MPLVAFRIAKIIRSEIIRSGSLTPTTKLSKKNTPWNNCKSTCNLIFKGFTITSTKNGKSIKINANGTCKSRDVVYVARCKISDLLYIGETCEELKTRCSKLKFDAHKRPNNCELPKHISEMEHDFENDLAITILIQGFK